MAREKKDLAVRWASRPILFSCPDVSKTITCSPRTITSIGTGPGPKAG
ncbi:hypothetical protein COLO4_06340 [Corchorus olitorius]|uniref:Uncharacterized protein n=1 Tax=Corchorus olitorius TaxID=93759 RepID=A0A1R3KNI9_9ROSI|nr:hypothetical protein COLO4_06340 [Corchorus olitorius]